MSDVPAEKFGIVSPPMDALTRMSTMHSPLTSYMGQQPGVSFGIGSATRLGRAGYPTQNLIVTTINENHEYHQHWNDSSKLLFDCVSSLLLKMDALTTEISELRNAKTFVVPLTTIAPEPFEMMRQIPVTIQGYGEDFVASFTEANVSASGETEADAIANLKESLASTYDFLESIPEDERGPLPARQWQILTSVLAR